MPLFPDPPPASNFDDGLGAMLTDVAIPGDSATVTRPLPQRVCVQGEHLEPVSDRGSLDDPTRPTADLVDLLARLARDVFLGAKGDLLNAYFHHCGDLFLWRQGISSETGAGLSRPSNGHLLEAAGVALLQAVQGFGRVRAVLDLSKLTTLPARLGRLRFRRKGLAIVALIHDAMARAVVEEEVAVDAMVRPTFERLKPLLFAAPVAHCLEPLRLLIEQPGEKAQVTRHTFEKGYAEGLAQGLAQAEVAPPPAAVEPPAVLVINHKGEVVPPATPAPRGKRR